MAEVVGAWITRCPLCGKEIEPEELSGGKDAVCPHCFRPLSRNPRGSMIRQNASLKQWAITSGVLVLMVAVFWGGLAHDGTIETGVGQSGSEVVALYNGKSVAEWIILLEDKEHRRFAARILGKIGPDAKKAMPALTRALRDQDSGFRMAAAFALKKIDPVAAAKAGVR